MFMLLSRPVYILRNPIKVFLINHLMENKPVDKSRKSGWFIVHNTTSNVNCFFHSIYPQVIH